MATSAVAVSREEYLLTAYRPDCDWIEGELRERNLGEQAHALLQTYFAYLFRLRQQEWRLRVLTEQRVQVLPDRYRIPDVCAVPFDAAYEAILRTPPTLVIEILSREDRMSDIQERMEDYLAMGVSGLWIVDPLRRKAYFAGSSGSMEPVSTELTLPGTPVQIPLPDVFAELDRLGVF